MYQLFVRTINNVPIICQDYSSRLFFNYKNIQPKGYSRQICEERGKRELVLEKMPLPLLQGPSHQRPDPLIRPDQICNSIRMSEIVNYYLTVPLYRGHPSFKALLHCIRETTGYLKKIRHFYDMCIYVRKYVAHANWYYPPPPKHINLFLLPFS